MGKRGGNISSDTLWTVVQSAKRDELGRVSGDWVYDRICKMVGHDYAKASIKGRLRAMNEVLGSKEAKAIGHAPIPIVWKKKVRRTQKESLLALLAKQ